VYLVGFVIRIYHDARSPERQILQGDVTRAELRGAVSVLHTLSCPYLYTDNTTRHKNPTNTLYMLTSLCTH